MALRVRYRVAAVVLSGLIFGAPLLTNGTASAEQVDTSDRRVSFNGDGVLGLTCESKPSVESMKVPADSVVQVRNRTGHDAQLKLGGAPKGMIPEDGSADVVFRRGTTAVLLTPECDSDDDVVPMIVTAEPSAAASKPDQMPAPPNGDASTLTRPSGHGAPPRTNAGSAKSGLNSNAQRPGRTGPHASRPGSRQPSALRPSATVSSAASASGVMPQGDASQRLRTRQLRGTDGVGAPAFAGMPLGERKTILPSSAAAVPATPVGDEAIAAGTMTPMAAEEDGLPLIIDEGEPSGSAAGEPVAAVGSIREGKPIGLLGLTALVCVLGVSIAAIRAIVSQRASRANMP
ncbi:hypothetical protein ACTI_20980 [Actinoplanes sp. OR16]|uniref:hypothetical protein n=1 Tax=Actinoplanes sp. OR16 TaxID=946334 RepID=UPI000F6F5FF8|nr:hypothetical protein [Actinoplanes sp. OR16]BBH65413.1 hypothetical protein ACTI_20980 [Actinoplanes sp. OR16]